MSSSCYMFGERGEGGEGGRKKEGRNGHTYTQDMSSKEAITNGYQIEKTDATNAGQFLWDMFLHLHRR